VKEDPSFLGSRGTFQDDSAVVSEEAAGGTTVGFEPQPAREAAIRKRALPRGSRIKIVSSVKVDVIMDTKCRQW
jgi:hypothetical protein